MKCEAIWETIHEVGKCDFEIFMVSHRGQNEEYSGKKNVTKAQFYAEVWRSEGQSCKKLVLRKKHLKLFFHDA